MGIYRNLQLFFSHDSTWFLKNRLLGFGPNTLSGRKTKVLGDPHLYHHLSYLDISFQEKLKSEKGPEKHILWDIRAANATNRRFLDRPRNCVRVACQGNQSKQAKPCSIWSTSTFPTQAETLLSTFWRSCRYVNGPDLSSLVAWYQLSDGERTDNRNTLAQAWHFKGMILSYIVLSNMLWTQTRKGPNLSFLENSSLRSAKPMGNSLGRSKFRHPYYPSHSYSKGQPEAVTPCFIITVMEKQGRTEWFISPPEFIHSTNMIECLQWALNHSCWMNKENSKEIKDASHHCAFLQQCMKLIALILTLSSVSVFFNFSHSNRYIVVTHHGFISLSG